MWKFLASIFLLTSLRAEANLQVFPTRAVLSDRERVAQLSLRHTGQTPMSYKISAVFYRMQPDGSMVLTEKPSPEDRFGGEYFRFSPQRVNLTPNVEQVVRIMIKKPADLAPGEYRAHLYFEEIEALEKKAEDPDAKEARMQLKARMAIAVPIIVKQGEIKVENQLSALELVNFPDQTQGFSLDWAITGNGFSNGDFLVSLQKKDGSKVPLAQVNSVSIYIPKRKVVLPFNLTKEKVSEGTLTVELHAPQTEGAKLLASISKEITKNATATSTATSKQP